MYYIVMLTTGLVVLFWIRYKAIQIWNKFKEGFKRVIRTL
jgi:hypothetical protein